MKRFKVISKYVLLYSLLAIFGISLGVAGKDCVNKRELRGLDCSSYIQGLPPGLEDAVDQSCMLWLKEDLTRKSELRRYLRNHDIIFIESPAFPEETQWGFVARRGGLIEFHVLANHPTTGQDIPIEFQQVTAFHEMGHLILWSAGIQGSRSHHHLMNEYQLCPGPCARTLRY